MPNGNEAHIKENAMTAQQTPDTISLAQHPLTETHAHYDRHGEEAMSHRWHVHSNYRQS